MSKFEIYFLNNGSALFQTPNYCHVYDDMDQLADDYTAYLVSGNTSGWDGDEPESRVEYDSSVSASGGYVMYDHTDIDTIDSDAGWSNISGFISAMEARS
jgi:hypothetical protein